ncbi:3-ketoacyl-CoA synthase 6-like protein [Trifolium pratense]|uniref:very-long-chain 3-oxoacyl-CoA synthase n=1 Tax=Trifolium pratense TaxID=57577 RepID=A0A2K3NCC3_TRIPR|nr:3-ketoacyl-CoA synthase 6-like protein [Trifolium pratense]
MFEENNFFDEMEQEAVDFHSKINAKSGFSDETAIPQSLAQIPKVKALTFALEEAELIMFSAVKDLLQKTKINPKAIDILITNSSIFCPTPCLSTMVVNKFKMRSNIKSFHLSGMGCSAGIIAVSLAKDLLRVHRNSLALIVSTETLSLNWYTGKVPSMLLTNCLFRMGGSAILMSSRVHDKHKAKYELKHIVRTINAYDDQSYACVYQDVDSDNKEGGRAVIQAIEKNLKLRKQDVEPSQMALYRFGNTSSSSIWYELSYIEAKGRMKCGDRVWQIAFGSGFKCNSAVWKCLGDVKPDIYTAWRDTIHSYPVDILETN